MDEVKKFQKERYIEIIVVVLLGATALLTAWATWIGSLHSGNKTTNYTISTNLASEGYSEYNAGVQSMLQDMLLWNDIADLQFDFFYALDSGDEATAEQIAEKLYWKLEENLSEEFAAHIAWDFLDNDDYVAAIDEGIKSDDDYVVTIDEWMKSEDAVNTPFFDEEFIDSYFTYADELLAESEAALEQGKEDNTNGDKFGLVTVIFSIALFLLGMVSTIDDIKNKYILLGIAILSILGATIFMLTIPMPTGFNLLNFFG